MACRSSAMPSDEQPMRAARRPTSPSSAPASSASAPRPILPKPGCKVTVFDRTGICEETSSGNAAAFAFSDVLPLAHKGMMRQLPKWLADPLGPLAIPPAYLPKLLPWLCRFWRAGAPQPTTRRASPRRPALMQLAEAEWMGLMQRSGTRGMLREDGSLELYESEAEFQASLPGWAARDRFGIAYRHLDGDELAALSAWPVAALRARHLRARLEDRRRSEASRQGDLALRGSARARLRARRRRRWSCRRADGIAIQLTAGPHDHGAASSSIAAGAWSHLLARQLGDRIPLETERGYNTTLPKAAFDVKRQLIFSGPRLRHHAARRPACASAARSSSAGSTGRPTSRARRRCWRRRGASCRASIRPAAANGWAIVRRCRTRCRSSAARERTPNVFYAFGHGHLGLTQAAATGRLDPRSRPGAAPAIDLRPFRAQRF